jgi:hypothetical protein
MIDRMLFLRTTCDSLLLNEFNMRSEEYTGTIFDARTQLHALGAFDWNAVSAVVRHVINLDLEYCCSM